MKKVILGSVLAAAAAVSVNAQAASASICSGGNATTAAVASGATNFIKTGFNARCSNNVMLVGDDGGTYYRVGAASVKGKNAYGGSTAGGAITGAGCGATGCTTSDAASAATNALTS